jgi:hypothetical protein
MSDSRWVSVYFAGCLLSIPLVLLAWWVICTAFVYERKEEYQVQLAVSPLPSHSRTVRAQPAAKRSAVEITRVVSMPVGVAAQEWAQCGDGC